MPNALLARYFALHGLFADFDFSAMKEAKPDDLFVRWLDLADAVRNKVDADFQKILELSCEKGFRAIIDEADFHFGADHDERDAFVERLANLPSHYERAMVTFLDHHAFWRGATRFHHADMLPYWRKRKNLPQVNAAVDTTSLSELSAQLSRYFHMTEGRGRHCKIEPLRRRHLDYFFCYPEDYSQQDTEWVGDELEWRPHNPAFEVIYVYSRAEGSLDLNFRGANKAVEPLQQMFASIILKAGELPPDPKDTRIYDLGSLGQRSFEFATEPGSGIQDVAIRKLRLSSKAKRGERIIVEADSASNPRAIYDLLDRVGPSLPMSAYYITQVEIVAKVASKSDELPKPVVIRLTYPNFCSLKYDEVDLKLRDMLHLSGIEPKEPEETPEPASEAPSDSAKSD